MSRVSPEEARGVARSIEIGREDPRQFSDDALDAALVEACDAGWPDAISTIAREKVRRDVVDLPRAEGSDLDLLARLFDVRRRKWWIFRESDRSFRARVSAATRRKP